MFSYPSLIYFFSGDNLRWTYRLYKTREPGIKNYINDSTERREEVHRFVPQSEEFEIGLRHVRRERKSGDEFISSSHFVPFPFLFPSFSLHIPYIFSSHLASLSFSLHFPFISIHFLFLTPFLTSLIFPPLPFFLNISTPILSSLFPLSSNPFPPFLLSTHRLSSFWASCRSPRDSFKLSARTGNYDGTHKRILKYKYHHMHREERQVL